MKKFSYKRAFLNWLQLKGIYHAYFSNYYGDVGISYNPRNFLTNDHPNHYISSAFSWAQTPEGGMYWCCKHDDWLSYLQNINKKYGYN